MRLPIDVHDGAIVSYGQDAQGLEVVVTQYNGTLRTLRFEVQLRYCHSQPRRSAGASAKCVWASRMSLLPRAEAAAAMLAR